MERRHSRGHHLGEWLSTRRKAVREPFRNRKSSYWNSLVRAVVLWRKTKKASRTMTGDRSKIIRCAIYTRKSSEEGLEQSFNSLDAQREACTAYISSQRHEGWQIIGT